MTVLMRSSACSFGARCSERNSMSSTGASCCRPFFVSATSAIDLKMERSCAT